MYIYIYIAFFLNLIISFLLTCSLLMHVYGGIETIGGCSASKGCRARHVEEENQLQKVVDQSEETARYIIELPSQCSCTSTNVESPDQERLKEPLSTPF
jgi:hypothetical protein